MGDSQVYALGPGEGRSIDLGEFAMTVKADERETGGVVSVLEAEEPSGFGPPIHVHHDCAEAFYVLEGEYIMFLEDREVVCPAGSFIFIPRGIRHGFRVGNVPSRYERTNRPPTPTSPSYGGMPSVGRALPWMALSGCECQTSGGRIATRHADLRVRLQELW